MSRSRTLALFAGGCGVLLLLWFITRAPEEVALAGAGSQPTPASQASSSAPRVSSNVNAPKADRPVERSTLADRLNAPNGTLREDLAVVSEVLAAFRSNFPRLGNPNGSNADITAALTGRNKLDLALIPPDHPAINRDGELCDRWGTPFFFHAESGTRMTIRSAGPDRRLWTADDEELAP
jgi:hypothetical protein